MAPASFTVLVPKLKAQILRESRGRFRGGHRRSQRPIGSAPCTPQPTHCEWFGASMPARQGKRPTPCTPRCDKPLGRLKSFRSSRHRRHALTELALTVPVTWVARSPRGARRSMHRERHEVSRSFLRARIAKAPGPALGQPSMLQGYQSLLGPRHELHRDGRCSKRFAKCQLYVSRSHQNGTT